MKKRKGLKITGIVVLVLFIVINVAFAITGNYLYNLALNPDASKDIVLSADHNQIGDGEHNDYEEIYNQNLEWLEEKGGKTVSVTSDDDLKLQGSYLKNEVESKRWVIVFHGYGGHGKQMLGSAKEFYKSGYNILMPDARGCGDSEGHYIGMGWHERKDALKWMDFLIAEDSSIEIVLYGVSMGGATVMMISGEDLPTNVKAIVEDCGYTSAWDEFSYQLKQIFGMPAFPLMHYASLISKAKANFFLDEADAVKQVAKSKTPMLFIHGDSDTFVPSYMVDIVYEAANVPKDKIVVEGAGHGTAASVMGDAYWVRVNEFIDQFCN